jgi:hypothetical protein
METNMRAQLAQPSLPHFSSSYQADRSLGAPSLQCPDYNPQVLGSFVANAQSLASLDVSARFLSLSDILANARLSKSSAYEYGLVPMYDKDGRLVENKKAPPFPWVQLPSPIVKVGKKLWDKEDIAEWHRCIRARSRQSANDPARNNKAQREVMP